MKIRKYVIVRGIRINKNSASKGRDCLLRRFAARNIVAR